MWDIHISLWSFKNFLLEKPIEWLGNKTGGGEKFIFAGVNGFLFDQRGMWMYFSFYKWLFHKDEESIMEEREQWGELWGINAQGQLVMGRFGKWTPRSQKMYFSWRSYESQETLRTPETHGFWKIISIPEVLPPIKLNTLAGEAKNLVKI